MRHDVDACCRVGQHCNAGSLAYAVAIPPRPSADGPRPNCAPVQVVQVCAEHKKPLKLAKHLEQIKEGGKGMRNPPRVLIFANRQAGLRCDSSV